MMVAPLSRAFQGCRMPNLVRLFVPVAALGVGAALVALPGGCSRKTPAAPATVRGAVTFQGRPVAGGLVVFSPDPERGGTGKPVRGEIGTDGRYDLRPAGQPAVPPGWYRVAIAAPPAAPASALDPVFPPGTKTGLLEPMLHLYQLVGRPHADAGVVQISAIRG